jgi:DNA-binding winged helix-turn-helix (wHTH) protein
MWRFAGRVASARDFEHFVTSCSRYRFDAFTLDVTNRTLLRDGAPVALNARYFDALALLVREHGRLVGKQRFFDSVWGDTVVTDAALTQCIKDIRRQLGDDAGAPRFVRTVPGHGYCFIAEVVQDIDAQAVAPAPPSPAEGVPPSPEAARPGDTAATTATAAPVLPRWLSDGVAATVGGAAAGLIGGLLYGSALTLSPQSQGLGTLSVLLVLLALAMLVGMSGAAGVGFGIAAGRLFGRGASWMIAGGALGGLLVGGLVKLLGSDAFSLLVGSAPAGITGGLEGAAIGSAVAAGLCLGGGADAPHGRRPAIWAAATTGLAGALIPLAGGSMMATSLVRVATTFDHSRLDMAPLGRLFGEPEFGALAQAALGALEGAVFGGCVVAALVIGRRRLKR